MNYLLWITLLLIGFALGNYKYENAKRKTLAGNQGKEFLWMNRKVEMIMVLSVLMIALSIRVWEFGSIPYGIHQDEAMAAVDAKALADYGTDRFGMHMPVHFTAWGYGQMSVFLSYCMVPFIKLFGFNTITIRLPILIFSMLGLWAIYQISLAAFDRRVAFFVLVICAVDPWHFMQSRWALDCNMFPHVFALGVMFLLMGIKKQRYLYLSMVFFALSMYCYGVALYTVPLFLVIMCIYLLRKKIIKYMHALICVGVYLLVSWPFLLTMMINTFKWNTIETPFFTIPYFEDSVRSKDILFFSEHPLRQLWENIKYIRNVLVDAPYLSHNYVYGYTQVPLFLLPFAILGLILLCKQCFKKRTSSTKAEEYALTGKVAVLSFMFIGIWVGICTNYVNANRINIIFYPIIMLCGLGVSYVVDYAKKWSLVLIPMFVGVSVAFLITYFGRYAQEFKILCYTDFIDAVNYLEDTDCSLYVITPYSKYKGDNPVNEIITLYTLEVDSRYFQNLYPDEQGHFYYEKFRYARAEEMLPYASENTGFVISYEECDLFTGTEYNLVPFGSYYVAVPN